MAALLLPAAMLLEVLLPMVLVVCNGKNIALKIATNNESICSCWHCRVAAVAAVAAT